LIRVHQLITDSDSTVAYAGCWA